MTSTQDKQQIVNEEPKIEDTHEDEEEEPVDEELQKAMKNVNIDEGIFGVQQKKENSNVDKSKPKTSKKKKGQDFLDFANKNGIQLNFEYEEKVNLKDDKQNIANVKEVGQKKFGSGNARQYNSGGYGGNYKGERYNNEGYNKYPQKNYQKKQFNPKKNIRTGNNKFDQCNMHLPKMMNMMQPLYNPYLQGGMAPQYVPNMMSQPQMNMQYFNPNQGMEPQMVPVITVLELKDTTDESIYEFMENYLLLENFNQDLYLRNRVDDNGFIDVSEIANHNKLRSRGVTLEKLTALFADNSNKTIESAVTEEGVLFLRNRAWEQIKDKLYSIQWIQQQKRMMKANQYANPMNTLNYVSTQNNYFFNSMPNPSGDNMQAVNNMYQQYPMMNMGNGINMPNTTNGEQTETINN
jgi:hypothetical protein